MAVNVPTTIYDLTGGGSQRLGGALAPGQVLANGNTYRERLRVAANGVDIHVRAKMTVAAGTPTVQLVPETANVSGNSLAVSDCTTGLTGATNLVTATEASQGYTPYGESFVDVVIDCTPVSASGTIVYVDVSARTA